MVHVLVFDGDLCPRVSGFVKRNDFVEYGTVVDTEDVIVERVEIGGGGKDVGKETGRVIADSEGYLEGESCVYDWLGE